MVNQVIVLGHVISNKGIEVDKAKVKLISKLSSPQMSKQEDSSLAILASTGGSSKIFQKLQNPFISCWKMILSLHGMKLVKRASNNSNTT